MPQAQGRPPQDIRTIPLSQITPSLTNSHTGARFRRTSLAGLAASIREDGIIQPLLVRPIKDEGRPGRRFEIVAGERRYRAAEIAGLRGVPCIVTELCDAAAVQKQLVENLQREGLHPLDEAKAFLRLKKEAELDVVEIAARVGKDARDVARRLSLNNLIKAAREDFRADRITLGHALEICRLEPDVQRAALAACYETDWQEREDGGGYDQVPDKSAPRSVEQLRAWLRANVQLNLKAAPFKTDDERLREDGLTCVECPSRTGANATLFADVKGADTCLNPACFSGKVQTLIQITAAGLDAKRETPAPLVSTHWTTTTEREGRKVLGRIEYEPVEGGRDERCEFAEQAVYVEGDRAGRTAWICREATCKDHKGRVRGHASVAVSTGEAESAGEGDRAAREAKNRRKQELFDIKVDEAVRKRVMAEAVKAFTFPLERETLNWIALAHFRRIPHSDQRTIVTVFGFTEDEARGVTRHDDGALETLAALDDTRLMQFMVLCSVAHFGANQYGNRRVSQQAVTEFGAECNVNTRLIDAQVRHELSPKKYKAEHKAYLDAVEAGRESTLPVVYEQARPVEGQQAQRAA